MAALIHINLETRFSRQQKERHLTIQGRRPKLTGRRWRELGNFHVWMGFRAVAQ